MVIDCITFNGEYDLWDLRFNILKDYVDEFIVCEASTTFSGNSKPLYFEKIKDQYPDVKYFVIDENYTEEEITQAENSPNTKGASHWKHEFLQKESIKKALTHLKDNDIVFIGDVDEIWDPKVIGVTGKLRLRVYPYYLNNLSDEVFYGPISYRYKDIKNECLNHLRSDSMKNYHFCGWHFTSQGGLDEVRRKLNDSYTAESYNTSDVQAKLEERFGKQDYIGRGFTFTIDETDWPDYLKANKEKYAKLLHPSRSI